MSATTSPLLRWARAFADDVTSGAVDFLEVVEMAVEELEQELELCPACVSRPIRPKTTAGRDGQCQACHLHHLAEAHREKLAEIEAWQEQATAKKALQRLRDASGDDLPADLAASAKYSRRRRSFEAADLSAADLGDAPATMDTQDASDPEEGTCTR